MRMYVVARSADLDAAFLCSLGDLAQPIKAGRNVCYHALPRT